MTRGPDAGRVDTTPAAVLVNTVDHQVEIILPAIHDIITQQNLTEAGPVCLHVGITFVFVNRLLATEQHDSLTEFGHRRTHIVRTRVHRNTFTGNACLTEGFGHPIGCPWFRRTRLQHQANLHRQDRHPEGMYARRIRRQYQTEHRRIGLVAHHHAPFFFAVTPCENIEGQAARQRIQDLIHVFQYERDLFHVAGTHPLGHPGAGGLNPAEFLGSLSTVAQRQFRRHVEVGSFFADLQQFGNRDFPQQITGPLCFPHVHFHQARIGLMYFG